MDAGCIVRTIQLAGMILSDEIAARRDFVFHRNARVPSTCSAGCGTHRIPRACAGTARQSLGL
jgi:hypothetical protein